jgi:radical SAM protein with 4Fe4S-binding SPASM domain
MRICGEILRGTKVTQIFETQAPFFNGLSVLVATYEEEARSSHLELELFQVAPTRVSCAKRVMNLGAVYDNSFIEIFMTPDAESTGKVFELVVWSDDASPHNAATLYLSTGVQRIAGHLACDAVGVTGPNDGLIAEVSYVPPLSNDSIPPNLEISLLSQCNLNCVHCISRETRKSVNRLAPEARAEIKKWAGDGRLRTTYTDFSGDIFWADSRFGGELDFFIDLNIPFHIDTNGTHVSEDSLKRCFASRVTSINVSIDAAEPETYRAIRRGSPPLSTIFSHMASIKRMRDDAGRSDVTLSASFVLMKSNVVELPKFIQLVSEAGFDEVRTIHLQAHSTEMLVESLWHHQNLFNEIRTKALAVAEAEGITLFIDRAFVEHADQEGTSLCKMPWNAAYLLANGDVLACCIPGLKMGNIHKHSMEQIWNGETYQELRRTVNSNERPAACRACPFNRKTNNPLSYMPILAEATTSPVKIPVAARSGK